MNYAAFFGILIPFEMCLAVTSLALVRRKTMRHQPTSWRQLFWRVLVLCTFVDVLSLLPVVGVAAAILWLVAFKRLSGLDVLSTVLLSGTLGVINFTAMLVLARYFQVPLAGQ